MWSSVTSSSSVSLSSTAVPSSSVMLSSSFPSSHAKASHLPPMSLRADEAEQSSGAEDDPPSPSSIASTSASSSTSTSASIHLPSSSSSPPSPASYDSDDAKFSAEELLHTRTVLLTGNDVGAKREELRSYFHRTFSLYEGLFSLLSSDESFYQQPDLLRHPLIFYFGHTAVFFINKLVLARLITRRVSPSIEAVCAIGVDEMSWDDCNAANYQWPTVNEVREYRDEVRVTVDRLISRMPLTLPITQSSPAWVLLMGIEHERIHLETSSVLFRQLPLHHIRPSSLFPLCPSKRLTPQSVPSNTLLPIPGGSVHLGKLDSDATYGWDNEFGSLDVEVQPFQAASMLVSNAEFLQFVTAGGYGEERWWGEEGWKYIQYRQLSHPLFWVAPTSTDQSNGGWRLRAIAEEVEMPWDWPVEVNYLEAKAFCNWKANRTGRPIRMPTEAEWNQMRNFAFPLHLNPTEKGQESEVQDQPYWRRAPGNVNLEHFASASPVDAFAFGQGLFDVVGNVWQWTESPITAFPGFAPHPLYDDFSVPTFDGRHHMLMGGSFISTGNESIRSARYAFRRHFMQHAGFRYIDSDTAPLTADDVVYTEPDTNISKIIHQHFALAQPLNLPNYHQAIASVVLEAVASASPPLSSHLPSVLEVGCGVGRTAFELAATGRFSRVTGVDRTARIIRLASHLQHADGAVGGAGLPYQLPTEGELQSYHEVSLDGVDLHLPSAAREGKSLLFLQGDVNNLDERHRGVDVLVLNGVVEQLNAPLTFLSQIHNRLTSDGLLVVATTGQWDEEVTAKDLWLGGRRENGEAIDSKDGLRDALLSHFTLVQEEREVVKAEYVNKRKAVIHTVGVSVWRRRS